MEAVHRAGGRSLPHSSCPSVHQGPLFLRQEVLRSDPLPSPSGAGAEALGSPRIRSPAFPSQAQPAWSARRTAAQRTTFAERTLQLSVSVHRRPLTQSLPLREKPGGATCRLSSALKDSSGSACPGFPRPHNALAAALPVTGHAGPSPAPCAPATWLRHRQGPVLSGSGASACETPQVKPTRALLRLHKSSRDNSREVTLLGTSHIVFDLILTRALSSTVTCPLPLRDTEAWEGGAAGRPPI